MIVSIVTWGSTLLMRAKLLMMRYGFVGRGMNGECDQMKRREASGLKEFSWLDLPSEVLESIILKLPFEDEARMACVCKSWKDIIQTSPPIYPVGKSPLLLHVKSRGEEEEGGKGAIFHYYSPLVNKTFKAGYPLDLGGYEIISAIDGGLLIYSQDELKIRLVDPLDHRSYDFPDITNNISFNGTAIGVYKNSYAIFLIDTSHENEVAMHLYKQGTWALDLVYDNGEEPFNMSSNPVYCNGRFYCLGTKGDRLGVFDLIEWTWRIRNVEFVNKYDDDDDDVHCSCCYYLVDWIHTVMAVRVETHGRGIHLFLLDREKMVWEETDDLGGRSLFLGSTLSFMSLPTAKILRNRVFLPHSHQDETKTVIDDITVFWGYQYFFRSKSSISSKGKDHAATTSICCCKNSGEESLYLGSIKNQNYSTIWYQPFYKGLYDAEKGETSVLMGFSAILKMFPLGLICCSLLLLIYKTL